MSSRRYYRQVVKIWMNGEEEPVLYDVEHCGWDPASSMISLENADTYTLIPCHSFERVVVETYDVPAPEEKEG